MALKFIFDVTMVLIFIYLVSYFNKKRTEKRIASKLNASAHSLLKWESVVVFVFVVFYIIRVLFMDFGYAFLVGLYFVDQASEDILDGDKSYIFITMYALDFLISITILTLFNLYSKKDEERLIKYYFITLQNE
jgi:hypothetical protein